MSFLVHSGVWIMFFATLLTLPEQGCPQCYRPRFRSPVHVAPPCCPTVSVANIKEAISSCYEQREFTFPDCKIHAFIFITVSNKQYCVDPAATWLQIRFGKLQSRQICCEVL